MRIACAGCGQYPTLRFQVSRMQPSLPGTLYLCDSCTRRCKLVLARQAIKHDLPRYT